MTFIPVSLANVQLMMQNDSQQMRTFIAWIAQRDITYSQNLTTAAMTAAGISAPDQTSILAFVADIARLDTFVKGTLPGVAADIRVDVANVLGVM